MNPCGQWLQDRFCGEPGRLYLPGDRCPLHTPAALLGRPEPTPDPASTLAALLARAGKRSIGTSPLPTLIDDLHVASGKRRATTRQVRAAQERVKRPRVRSPL